MVTHLPAQCDWDGSLQPAPDPVSLPRPRCGWAAAEGWHPNSDSTARNLCLSPACWRATCWWSGKAARRAGWSEQHWPDTAAVATSPPSGCARHPLRKKIKEKRSYNAHRKYAMQISCVLNGNVYRNYTLCYKKNKKNTITDEKKLCYNFWESSHLYKYHFTWLKKHFKLCETKSIDKKDNYFILTHTYFFFLLSMILKVKIWGEFTNLRSLWVMFFRVVQEGRHVVVQISLKTVDQVPAGIHDNRPQQQGIIKPWSRYDHSQTAEHLLTDLDLHFFSPKYKYKNPPHIHSHNHTQTDLKAIWTRWARMSWASSVMRFRSLSCLMKLSSSEALAIQKASAPAIFFCFCNVSTTATHRGRKERQRSC